MGGAWAGTAGQEGASVRMTRKGWVGAGEAGPKIRVEGAGPEGRDAEFSGSEVGEGGGDDVVAGLAVNAGWLGSRTEVSTQSATLEPKVETFLEL